MLNSLRASRDSKLFSKTTWTSGFFLLILGVGSLGGDFFSAHAYDFQNSSQILVGPSPVHWMGTDRLGRDLWARILMGGRMSLGVGIVTGILSLIMGLVIGGIAGWFGGWVDRLFVAFIDFIYGLPTLVVMILLKVFFDLWMPFDNPVWGSVLGTLFALSLVGWMTLGRLVRGQVLRVKSELFVDAARASGMTSFSLFFREILPNIMGPILVLTFMRVPASLLFESFLSFLGLGLQPPYSSWGTLAADGVDSLDTFPHLILCPAGVLFLSMMAFQILGDTLKDIVDLNSEKKWENFYEKV